MSAITNNPVFLENSNFGTIDENSTTLPILVLNLNPEIEINSNISIPIFSDSDIKLPNVTDLKEFPVTDSPDSTNSDGPLNPTVSDSDFLNYDFDALNFEAADSNGENKPTEAPLDFMNYDFGSVDFGEERTAEEAAPNLEDFATYDFDSFSFDTATDKPDAGFDLGNFADYNFDLFGEAKVEEEPEEYDFNDGWLDPDFKYVEKTEEEKRKDDEEFEEEWKSIVLPPAVRYKPPFIIDLNHWLLWGPPFLCMLFLCLVFFPCAILMRNDDKREKEGKKRKYGPQRLMVQVQREFHYRTSSGQWEVMPSCNENNCCYTSKKSALDSTKNNSNAISEIPPYKGRVSATTNKNSNANPGNGNSDHVVTIESGQTGPQGPEQSGSSNSSGSNSSTSTVTKDKNWSMYKNT